TIAQMQSSTVEHDPEVVHFNAQDLADLFAFQTVNLAQSESAGDTLWQGRQTVVEYFPEVATLDQFRRRCMPFVRRVIGVPMTLPWSRALKELEMFRTFVRLFAERRLAHSATKMIDDLVLENPDEPGSLRTTSFELLVSFQRCEKSFLHGVFGGGIVTHSKDGILEKVVAMVVQPTTGIRGFIGGRTLWLVHTSLSILDQ